LTENDYIYIVYIRKRKANLDTDTRTCKTKENEKKTKGNMFFCAVERWAFCLLFSICHSRFGFNISWHKSMMMMMIDWMIILCFTFDRSRSMIIIIIIRMSFDLIDIENRLFA